jgi:hypothetical protein
VRVLLDESLSRRLARLLPEHDLKTVAAMGWTGIQNGEMLILEAGDFDAFLTAGQNLEHQENLATLPIAVVVRTAPTNRIELLRPLIPAVTIGVTGAVTGEVSGFLDIPRAGPAPLSFGRTMSQPPTDREHDPRPPLPVLNALLVCDEAIKEEGGIFETMRVPRFPARLPRNHPSADPAGRSSGDRRASAHSGSGRPHGGRGARVQVSHADAPAARQV